jgi:protein-disulfide isomerase
MTFLSRKLVPGLLCLAALGADPPKKSALDKPTLEAYFRHLNVYGPQITVTIDDPKPAAELPGFLSVNVRASMGAVSRNEIFYVSKDGQHIIRGRVFDIAQNPFKPELDKLKTEFRPSLGTPGAPVVVVVFSDFECPSCRELAKTLHQNLLAVYPKQVRLYYAEFPLPMHPWAKAAAIAGRCVYRQNAAAFWDYHDWIFEHQQEITPDGLKNKVLEFANSKQIDTLQLSRCIDTRATEADVDKSVAMGTSLGINQTPTLFINGRALAGAMAWADLKTIIDYEIEYQKTAKNAGEDCGCEMKLPSPVGN